MAVSAAILTHAPAVVLPLKLPQNSNRQNRKNRTKNAEKPPEQAVFLRNLVGVRGLEPRASCSQSRRATNCATPRCEIVGLPGRILPKQARYQLRYTPIFLSSVFYCRAWRASGCHVSRCGSLGAAAVRAGHTKPCAYCLL